MILHHILIFIFLLSALDAVQKTNKFKKKEYWIGKEDNENIKRKKNIASITLTSEIIKFEKDLKLEL